jgi:hypothetical protein
MHFVEETRAAFDYVKMSGGYGVERAGAYCFGHRNKPTSLSGVIWHGAALRGVETGKTL